MKFRKTKYVHFSQCSIVLFWAISFDFWYLYNDQRTDMYIKTYFYSSTLRFRHLATGRFRALGCSYWNLILHICKYFVTLAHLNMWLHIFGFWNIFCTYFEVSSYIWVFEIFKFPEFFWTSWKFPPFAVKSSLNGVAVCAPARSKVILSLDANRETQISSARWLLYICRAVQLEYWRHVTQ